eukprot:21681-Pleurochrysis_carterae.AAC.1
MAQLTNRARNNRHKQERNKGETRTEKRTRLAKGGEGSRLVSDMPERKAGGRRGMGATSADGRYGSKEITGRT